MTITEKNNVVRYGLIVFFFIIIVIVPMIFKVREYVIYRRYYKEGLLVGMDEALAGDPDFPKTNIYYINGFLVQPQRNFLVRVNDITNCIIKPQEDINKELVEFVSVGFGLLGELLAKIFLKIEYDTKIQCRVKYGKIKAKISTMSIEEEASYIETYIIKKHSFN